MTSNRISRRIGHIYPIKRRIGHIYPLRKVLRDNGCKSEVKDEEQ